MSRGVVHIVDDDESFRSSLRRLLTALGYEVCAYASGAELLEAAPAARGCVIADLRMPGLNGLQLQSACVHAGFELPFVFLTGAADVPSAVSAMHQGAVDFLEKNAPREALVAALTRALERERAAHAARAQLAQLRARLSTLTERERTVLTLVVRGRMNKQIAGELGIHERTVKLHRSAITHKLQVRSVAELTLLVHEAS
ncbi:MAG TPA: response regulator [Steroidobacteraceae bacterium]|nr:response regulator [Steroidobacteraceae bacterium]